MTSLKECMEFVMMFTCGSIAFITAIIAAMVYYDNIKGSGKISKKLK